MRIPRLRLALRLFGLAAFALTVLSALGASEPWAM
jgi:hypothetical protein